MAEGASLTGMPVLQVDPPSCRAEDLAPAASWLRSGGIVAYPTDTFYGLAIDPASTAAARRLFDLKGRDPRAALPLVAASIAQVEQWCGPIGEWGRHLARAFWPGPLSLVLDAPPQVVPEVHGGRRTVAIRVPAHALAVALCEAWRAPLTATSANRSGAPPARRPAELGDLARDDRVLVLDAGECPGGLPSTIVDARQRPPQLVRAGAIAWERVLESVKG